jgi:hypothetical protein
MDAVNRRWVIAAVGGYAWELWFGLDPACDQVVTAKGTRFQIRAGQRGSGSLHTGLAPSSGRTAASPVEVVIRRMFAPGEALHPGVTFHSYTALHGALKLGETSAGVGGRRSPRCTPPTGCPIAPMT